MSLFRIEVAVGVTLSCATSIPLTLFFLSFIFLHLMIAQEIQARQLGSELVLSASLINFFSYVLAVISILL